MGITQLIVMD